jgi:hypothetical protein
MADPLSISASIVALIGATGTIAKGLRKLASLRNAPDTILALNNEVSDLRLIFWEIGSLLEKHDDRVAGIAGIDNILKRAEAGLLELETVLTKTIAASTTPNGDVDFNRVAWLRHKSRVVSMIDKLRETKANLNTALSVLSA